MDASLRFIARRPPRTGWLLFGLALTAVLTLPSLLLYSSMDLASSPVFLGVIAGLLLGLAGRRWLRVLAFILALFVPFLLLGLVPPLSVFLRDLRTLLQFRGTRPPFMLPGVLERGFTITLAVLQAAWKGDLPSLNWAITHLSALLGYFAAGLLGIGLRRGARPIVYSLPLLAAIVVVGITVRAGTFHIVVGIFATLLVALIGGFVSREREWEREGVGFSDLLRWDVGIVGSALLAAVILLGLFTPSAARNRLTTWIWSDIRLPAGLARLDKPQGGSDDGDGGGSLRLGGFRPGQNLELGQSLEAGGSDEVALTIRVAGLDAKTLPYWRGRIFDEYTGRGWTTGPIRNVVSQPTVFDEPPGDLIVQEVTDRREGRQLRYGLPDIVALNTGGRIEQSTLGTSASWTGSERQYIAYSNAPEPLSFIGAEAVESQRTLESYLVLPNRLPPRVVDLAKQLTDGAGSQTARATAIENYLRGLKYSYEVAPLPPDGDAVDQFLFSMRSGYCTYYASAMAIMARAAGIPSRVAIGYATGQYVSGSDIFIVREADAHSWPELYIDGQGWTRWEPTPVRPVPARSTTPERPRPAIPRTQPAEQPAANGVGWWPVFAILGALVVLVVVGRLRRLAKPLTPAAVHADLYRWGRRVGVAPGAGDSIEEYALRLARTVPAIRQPVERVARLLTARVYRPKPLDPSEERSLVSAWYNVRGILERRRESRL